ncbi:class I SAM-dependent methyltransferase [Methylobacillus arboreus]|uniref:class I SAM-dependent methyltransferase n=1 Tax=Methylobacillus arboreus TaxID=755170 RepID=UPI001E44F0A6|nr:class I SAM-dependent methyltransferase [Methylobacillus arboreus]MCB5191166.1 class I SAM-dependent methyltransferase [Methylobacillus arboreus]
MNPSTYPLMQKLKTDLEDARRREMLHHLSPEEMEQTLAEYARHLKLGSRERARLMAESIARRIHGTGSRLKRAGKQAVKHVGSKVAHAASHKLMEVAARIEQRAKRLDQDEQN